MRKERLWNILCCIVCLVIGVCLGMLYISRSKSVDLVKTVAHIPDVFPNYTCVYADVNNDIAYYMYTGTRSTINVGDTVYNCNNETCTVTEISNYGFYLDNKQSWVTGMSGSPIYDAGENVVGYVSTLNSDNVYCIWKQVV